MLPSLPMTARRAARLALAAAALLLPTAVPATPAAAAGFQASCPAAGYISQGYTPKHNGIDIANAYGTPIYAVGDGQVTASGPAQGTASGSASCTRTAPSPSTGTCRSATWPSVTTSPPGSRSP
ncbi:hypothetical protein GCM10010440_06540 [Kitasatospora cinereorecta]